MRKSKNKNKIIGVNTGLFLNPLRELYCNNSILKTGSIVAGIMLASCGGDKDNENKNNKGDKPLTVNDLSKYEALAEISNLLGDHPTDNDLKEIGLTLADIKDGKLTEEGKKKIEEYRKNKPDNKGKNTSLVTQNDKTIDLSKLPEEVKNKLAEQLEVKVNELQTKIDELKLNKDDINEKGELTASGLQKKNNSVTLDDNLKKDLEILGENEDKFIKYLNNLDDYFGSKKENFDKAIKDKNEEEIKKQVITLCETYAKDKNNDADIQFKNITEGLKNSKFIENKIKESISDANFKNVKYKIDKDNDKIKVTVTKDTEKVDFYLIVSAEDLFSLKITKDGKDVEQKLYRIKIEIDGELPKELTDLLVPKDKSKIKEEAEAKFKEVLEASIKTGDKIDVSDFQKLANTLKQFIEAAKNLLIGKYKENNTDKFLADVKKVEDLYEAFGKKDGSDYKNAIKTEFDAQLKSIKDELAKVNSGNLTEKINKIVGNLKLDDDNQKIGSEKIFEIVYKYSNDADSNNVIKEYIDGCVTYGIPVDKDGNATFTLYFENNDNIDNGTIAFAKNGKVGVDEINAINNDFKTKLSAKIATLKFGTLDNSTDCKTKISNDYITNVLKFESLSSIDPANITEEKLKEYCGKANCIVTADDVKDQIVKPVMKEVFGDAAKVKAVFTAVKDLMELKVGQTNTLKTNGLAGITKDDGANAVAAASDNGWQLGTATRLKTELLKIRAAIEVYNNDGKSTQVVKDFFKFYFGEVGTGAITGMTDGNAVPADLKWMRLGKSVAKWVFSKSGGYDNEQTMRTNYNGASKALAMSILLTGATVKMYNDNAKDSDQLKWFDVTANGEVNLDLTNGAADTGLGGKDLTVSGTAMGGNPDIKVDFDNMIICDKLKTGTSAAETGTKDFIVIPKIATANQWGGTQIVAQSFKDNFDNKAIKSDFALLALFLGYFKNDGTMIDIKVNYKQNAGKNLYVDGMA